jgi:23S rRNA (cytosine1962-C5)-methyltransferase
MGKEKRKFAMNKHVIISPEGEKWLDQGQMWMYRNNLVEIEEPAKTGDIVDVVTVENRIF